MNALQIVIKSCNPPTLWMGVASVAAGCAAATAYGYVDITTSILCLLFAILMQCTGNIAHRYYDEKNGYGENLRDGMTFEDEDGRPVLYCLQEGMKVFSGLAGIVGIAILIMDGVWTVIPGLCIVVINWLNNHGKRPWSRTLLYPIVTFLLFGPVAVIATDLAIIHTEEVNRFSISIMKPGFVMGAVMGLLAFNSHVIYRASHAMMGRDTSVSFARKYGIKVAAGIVTISTLIYTAIFAAAPIEMSIYTGYGFMFLPLVSMILSFISIYMLVKNPDPDKAWQLSLVNIVLVGIGSLILFWFVGYPNFNEFEANDLLILI